MTCAHCGGWEAVFVLVHESDDGTTSWDEAPCPECGGAWWDNPRERRAAANMLITTLARCAQERAA